MTDIRIEIIDKGASTEVTRENYTLDQNGITKWLQTKKIISKHDILLNYKDLTPWTRTGGETYGTSFEIRTNNQKKQIFIKALVTLLPEKSLLDWFRRREILEKNGISVSFWYHYADATIFEEFYPYSSNKVPFEEILYIGYKLDMLGFSTLKFTDDIRADKNGKPFFVDFGFDLGEPSNIKTTNAKKYLLENYPEKRDEIKKHYA